MKENNYIPIAKCMRIDYFFIAIIVVFVWPLSGCMMPHSYVDPTYASVDYDDITRRLEPYRLEIITEFQRNGEHYPKGDKLLKSHVDRIVRATSFAIPVTENAEGLLKIVVNNFGDKGEATAKGLGTGLTLGLIGSTVTDYYEMQAEFSLHGRTVMENSYQHAIFTTIGNKSGPPGLEPKTTMEAFDDVLEDLILRLINDIEESERVSPLSTIGGKILCTVNINSDVCMNKLIMTPGPCPWISAYPELSSQEKTLIKYSLQYWHASVLGA